MDPRRVREMLAMDQPAWGVWVTLPAPAIVEVAAYAGYDFVALDMEHCALDFLTIENMLRAAAATRISSFIRVPENNPKTILRAVEIGPDGIIIPHVRDAADVRRAVEAARFRPLGDRGMSDKTRAGQYGAAASDFLAFTQQVNRDLMVVALIEEASAVEDIEAIAALDGLDVCFIAPSDLSRSLGYMGTRNEPHVAAAVQRVAAAVRSAGKAKLGIAALHSNLELDGPACVALGCRMITYGLDAHTLLTGFRANLGRVKENV